MASADSLNRFLETGLLLLATAIAALGIYLNHAVVLDRVAGIFAVTGYASMVLVPLTLALVTTLIYAWLTPDASPRAIRKTLGIVAALSPLAGFLGTTFGMMEAISSLGLARDIDALLSMVGQSLHGMAEAIASTSWGLLNAMVAILYLRLNQPSTPEHAH